VRFGEDANRTRTQFSAENLALLRRAALNLIRQNGNPRESLRSRRIRAALNDEYRYSLINSACQVPT